MRRRDVVAALGVVVAGQALPGFAVGQTRKKIGFLYPGLSTAGASRLAAYREGLLGAGWDEGKVEIIARFAETVAARNAELAEELVAAHVDVLAPIAFISVE